MNVAVTSPQSAVSGAELVAKARELVPFLRKSADETNAIRRPTEEVRLRLKAAGLSRLWQPKRYGGAEARMRDGVDLLCEVGRGCGSTAWIVVQNVLHNLMLANWSEKAQDIIWGETPDALVSGILIPGIGKATKVEGGYKLSGRWPFVSGVEIAEWVIFTGDYKKENGEEEELHFVVPKRQVTVHDTWYTIGLRGSSSHDVSISDLFVPEYMSVSMDDLKGEGRSPGSKINTGAQYRIPPYSIFGCYIGSAALGIAEAAVEYYVANARKRAATVSGAGISSYTTQQVKVAEAQSAVIAARQIMYSVVDEAESLANRVVKTTVEDRTRFRALATYAGKLSSSAVNLVLEAGGGGVIYDRNPIARCVSDTAVANRHITQNWDVNASTYGRVLLGLPSENPMLDD
ncbi:acyl-CoA dehydrogenase family protein [Bradyrhizobium sp. Arg237L]|uniref:acyl-CoA dehydrogenase family protein n=1 Tax=Bradyrhizobium sp. Arg237L TaxID=3003352 RepID=UPI00249DC982|nr:acyl-CoA dehydrogenase family protein [Bradyrhizobium sp. Arg237L]MDI4234169.1 acyl-CoA dehydrogenase family protein [Bradyrhizobium sp. Arg237L]